MIEKKQTSRMYDSKGQAALMAILFFLLTSLAILGSIGLVSVSHLQQARELIYSRQSYATAESGLDDAVYRIANGKTVDDDDRVYLNKGSAFVDVPGIINGTRVVTSNGNIKNRFRSVTARFNVVPVSDGPFTSALNAGFLGISLAGNTTIAHVNPTEVANVFSNGSIDAGGGNADLITGSATVARSIAVDNDPVNNVGTNLVSYGQRNSDFDTFSGNPTYTRTLHDSAAQTALAQSFIVPLTAHVVQVKLYMRKKTALAPDLNVYVVPNNPTAVVAGGQPYTTSGQVPVSSLLIQGSDPRWSTNNWQWVTIQLNTQRFVIENEKYWIVFQGQGTDYSKQFEFAVSPDSLNGEGYAYGQNNCYGVYPWCNSTPDGNGSFGKGTIKYSTDSTVASPSWAPNSPETDIAFRVFMGEGTQTTIDGGATSGYVTQIDSIDACGDVKANTIRGTTDVHGDIYYQNIVVPQTTVTGRANINGAIPNSCTNVTTPQVCTEQAGESTASGACRDFDSPNEPSQVPLTFSIQGDPWQKAIDSYKQIALAGGTIGTQDITSIKNLTSAYINGSLHCHKSGNNNGQLNLVSGAVLYVKGGGVFEDNCEIRVTGSLVDGNGNNNSLDGYIIFEGSDTSFNSGKVDVRSKAKFFKNTDGPDRTGFIYVYALYHSISNFDPQEPLETIELQTDPTFGGGAFFAPYGEIKISSNGEAISLSSSHIQGTNSATIKYENGVASPILPQGNPGISAFVPTYFEFHEIE